MGDNHTYPEWQYDCEAHHVSSMLLREHICHALLSG